MKYMLDTNICIYLIKASPKIVLARLRQTPPGQVGVSIITVAELYYGIAKSQRVEQNMKALEAFLSPLSIAEFDHQAAAQYGPLRAELEGEGQVIGPYDLMIAAHDVALGTVLVTNNVREFSRIGSLDVTNWVD